MQGLGGHGNIAFHSNTESGPVVDGKVIRPRGAGWCLKEPPRRWSSPQRHDAVIAIANLSVCKRMEKLGLRANGRLHPLLLSIGQWNPRVYLPSDCPF
jgi:hypothetical protein